MNKVSVAGRYSGSVYGRTYRPTGINTIRLPRTFTVLDKRVCGFTLAFHAALTVEILA